MLTHFAIEFSYSEPASLNYKLLEVIQPLCLTAQSSENRVSISSTRVCLFNFGILFFMKTLTVQSQSPFFPFYIVMLF